MSAGIRHQCDLARRAVPGIRQRNRWLNNTGRGYMCHLNRSLGYSLERTT